MISIEMYESKNVFERSFEELKDSYSEDEQVKYELETICKNECGVKKGRDDFFGPKVAFGKMFQKVFDHSTKVYEILKISKVTDK
jgi:hypothetical protein